MSKFFLTLILLLSHNLLFSNESFDQELANKLIEIYGDEINLEQIEKVLEFDSSNRDALQKKAQIFDKTNKSLLLVKKILEDSGLVEIDSKYHYISIIYRLGLYNQVTNYLDNFFINEINNPNTLFYIADSYLRENEFDKCSKILEQAIYRYTNDIRFFELFFLLNKDIKILNKIYKTHNNTNSLIRIHSRLEDKYLKSLVATLLKNKIVNFNKDDFYKYNGNYQLFPILLDLNLLQVLNGKYYLDCNNDTFLDTVFVIESGNILYKGMDLNLDNEIDYEILCNNGIPQKIIFNNSYVTYDNYPFVDTILLKKDRIVLYNLQQNRVKLELPKLFSEELLIVDNSVSSEIEILNIIEYQNQNIFSEKIYLDQNRYYNYYNINESQRFDNFQLIIKNEITYELIDIDSDGFYDVKLNYMEGVIIDEIYNENKEHNWWLR